jgi:hypothetical protein
VAGNEVAYGTFRTLRERAAGFRKEQPGSVAERGETYSGPSDPAWYGDQGLAELCARVTPESTTIAALVRDVFNLDLDDDRPARSLSPGDISALREMLLARTPRVRPERIGYIGEYAYLGDFHAKVAAVTRIGDAEIPYCAEAWVDCEHAEKGSGTRDSIRLLLNRSPTIAPLTFSAYSDGLFIDGCGHRQNVASAKRGLYDISLSVITPHVRLMNDGKTPLLSDFREGITQVLQKAASAAYRNMVRPPRKISIKDAAYQIMREAYRAASDDGRLPANARQLMYAARPKILELTGIEKLSDHYFTQTLLPDFLNDNPEQTADWDVVFDARGHFGEPHTGRTIPVGTIDVRNYLGDRPELGPAVSFGIDPMFPTSGPEHRYRNVLFIEKEGFDPLLEQARIAERFDIAVMSTKGMSVTAARLLLDRLSPDIDRVLVLHDFDISGFSIFGTLGSDGRRYTYANDIEIIDIGFRLADIAGLQSEPVEVKGDNYARAYTLTEHGATKAEIDYLLGRNGGQPRRVELNAMTSRQFVDFVEAKLSAFCKKVLPPAEIIEQHARRLLEKQLAKQMLDEHRAAIAEAAAKCPLRGNLQRQVETLMQEDPELSWDLALAVTLRVS